MRRLTSPSAAKVAAGEPDFTEHDAVRAELERLAGEYGGREAVSAALMKILMPERADGLEGALRRLLRRHDEGLVHSEMRLMDPALRSSWAPSRQRSWGPSESAAELYRLRGEERAEEKGKNVDIRA
jgi:hypothetical protein